MKATLDDVIGDFRAIASGTRAAKPKAVRAKAKPKAKPKGKLTDAEIAKRSTAAERSAVATYNSMRNMTWMDETDMLIYSQAVGTIVARNKRLGLIP